MAKDYLPYIVVELFLIVYGWAILYRLNANLGSENEIKELKNIIYAFFVVLITDIFWAMAEGHYIDPPDLLNAAVNGISISAVTLGCFFWFKFVTYRLNPKMLAKKNIRILSAVPVTAAVTLNILSIFTGWVFYIDSRNHYAYGPLFPVQAVACYLYLVVPTAQALVRAAKTHAPSVRSECLIYASYMVPPLVVGLIEDYLPNVPILYLSMFMVIHILFLTIQDRQIYNDALTGLNNRRLLDSYLESCLPLASEQKPVLVFMMDLNRFKDINDTYGHVEGDDALKCAASALRTAATKHNAFAARYGGDEFCMVYSGNEYTGEDIVNFINEELYTAQENFLPNKPYTLTISIGWLACTSPQNEPAAVIAQVDERLYEDKRRWRAAQRGQKGA